MGKAVTKLIQLTWSDVAREAALEARERARHADVSAEQASYAAKQTHDMGKSYSAHLHRKAAQAHWLAGEAHMDAYQIDGRDEHMSADVDHGEKASWHNQQADKLEGKIAPDSKYAASPSSRPQHGR